MWDFVMDRSGAGVGFLRELPFPLPIYIPSASPQSSSLSPEAGTIGQEWPQFQWPHEPEFNKKVSVMTKNAYRILVGKPEGKRTLGRPRHRWVDNISCISIIWLIIVGTGADESIIEHSQVLTTTEYNTVTDFHTSNLSTLIYSVCFH
jgi:hypothetical protein